MVLKYIHDYDKEPIPIFASWPDLKFPTQKWQQGSFWIWIWIEVITVNGWNSMPLPHFFIKIEDVTVPAHFLQNGSCDVIKMGYRKIERKKPTGKSLCDLKSQVSLKLVQLFTR